MKSFLETFSLPFLRLKLAYFNLKEERKLRKHFYKNDSFKQADVSLKQLYQAESPYKICKDFMLKAQKSLVHVYGETPLSELHNVLTKCNLTEKDCFIDLGCGRGRAVFFVSSLFHCKSIGVDIVPLFCERAKKITFSLELPALFICEDISTVDLAEASMIYFYALCLEDELLDKMIQKLASLKPGTRIITVSFPLCEYSEGFSTLFSEKAYYPWGETELFVNEIYEK